jgi:hypothetical protein
MYSLPRLIRALCVVIGALLLVGCPPSQYCSVRNRSGHPVKVDFTFEGRGTLLPHFQLGPGEFRRVTAQRHLVVVAHDLNGHLIGSIDLGTIKENSRYYDPSTYTVGLAVTRSGVVPAPPD